MSTYPIVLLNIPGRGISRVPEPMLATMKRLYPGSTTVDVAKYSPDQPRDEAGRWTDGGGVETALGRVRGQTSQDYPDLARHGDGYAASEAEMWRRCGVPVGSAPNSGDVHTFTEAEQERGYQAFRVLGNLPGRPYDMPFPHPGDTTVLYRGPDGRTVGTLVMSTHEGRTGIDVAWVDPSARGTGIGTAMYDWAVGAGVDLYSIVGQAESFTPAGKAFTEAWLQHRIVEEAA